MKRRWIIAVLAVLVGVLLLGEDLLAARKLPSFTAKLSTGKQIKSSALIEKETKLLIVSFWATWCTPCKEELEFLRKYEKKYGDKGLKIVLISQDSTSTIPDINPYMESNKYNFPVILDPDKRLARMFGVDEIPHIFFVNAKSEIIDQHKGYKRGDHQSFLKVIAKELGLEEEEVAEEDAEESEEPKENEEHGHEGHH